ncbi:M20/M25/M40 family metallo-hydrolase [Collinsella sp. zg1085]|uniref:M20/M25/M40 family metallo-hydrolase n=1 Tax=Collinsella sp. zg1085 TaxID=2844380 RepID=UPI001C0C067F|nr:M20/M25/M40 family metallo-hydrolase [Collinsella sp. zg1085]QWT17818.1 M20/M25/M40 family metallo-hydrolase [Collinsella sp. zg1085]
MKKVSAALRSELGQGSESNALVSDDKSNVPAGSAVAELPSCCGASAGGEAQPGLGVTQFFAHEDDYPELDEAAISARLGAVIAVPSISTTDARQTNRAAFEELHTLLRHQWSRVFAAAELIQQDLSLLLLIPGSDPTLDPIMMMAHLDVVPIVPGTEVDWTHAPFSGYVDETFIWGRGAIDMKSQLTGMFEAVDFVLSQGVELRRGLILACGQDEETLQQGSKALAAELEQRGIHPAFLLDEGDYRIVDGAVYGAPGMHLMHAALAEKGYADVILTAKSSGGHSSNPYGGSSLEVLAHAISRIANLTWPVTLTPLTQAMLLRLLPELYEGPLVEMGINSADELVTQADEIAKACLGHPELYPLVTTTCAPTMIEGGSTGANVLPQDMWANINFRTLAGTTAQDVLARCQAAIADLPVTATLGPGATDPSPADALPSFGFDAIAHVAARYFQEQQNPITLVPSTVIGATDAASYSKICSECIRFSAFTVDDAESQRGVHGTDERISRRAYLQGIRFYIRLITEVAA